MTLIWNQWHIQNVATYKERCWSGRTGTPGKRVGMQVSRGFESHSLRQNLNSKINKLIKDSKPCMPKKLVIVESPAKAKTIGRYLGKDYEVRASVGHIRDLPAKTMAVDIQNDFKPEYEIMRGKKTTIQDLKKLANNSEVVYLATDSDREGEAISWHILESISTKTEAKRVIFHEITEQGIKEAFEHPTSLNMELVNAYQARRILDRVVGYELSPLLWKKFTNGSKLGLSAGRVQSIALKLVVEREREINNFQSKEFWDLSVKLNKKETSDSDFVAKISGNKKYEKDEAKFIENALRESSFTVAQINIKSSKSKPPAPYTTSTLQQEASRKLRGFSVSRTMRIAQQLYEGLPLGSEGETGIITYMRTDSTTLSTTAISEITEFIKEKFGNEYIGTGVRSSRRKTAVAAQEAHEAIRPTSILRTPEILQPYLSPEQLSLYTLIWKRTLASRMAESINKITTITINADGKEEKSYNFFCSGSQPEFDGYMSLYKTEPVDQENDNDDDDPIENIQENFQLPSFIKGEQLNLVDVNNVQKFTRPAPRYTQATFVKKLEESGIGRPSTYAEIMTTLEKRNYWVRENGRYKAEPLGEAIVDQLDPFFPNIMDIQFTANFETSLDDIANGNKNWVTVLKEFYEPYREMYVEAESSMPKITLHTPTGESCPECERPLVEKIGRNGKFIACTGFPECRYTKPILQTIGVKCPQCSNELVERKNRRGRLFYGCCGFPNCNFLQNNKPLISPCPECSGLMTQLNRNEGQCINCEYTESLDTLNITS